MHCTCMCFCMSVCVQSGSSKDTRLFGLIAWQVWLTKHLNHSNNCLQFPKCVCFILAFLLLYFYIFSDFYTFKWKTKQLSNWNWHFEIISCCSLVYWVLAWFRLSNFRNLLVAHKCLRLCVVRRRNQSAAYHWR